MGSNPVQAGIFQALFSAKIVCIFTYHEIDNNLANQMTQR